MVRVFVQFIPLALAAITPTMVLLVVALLPTERGPAKAVAVVAGRFVMHLSIAIGFLYVFSQHQEGGRIDREIERSLPLIFIATGIVLLIMAAWFWYQGRSPHRQTPSVAGMFSKVGPVPIFISNALIVLVSIRLMALVFAGTAMIEDASLYRVQELIAAVVLALAMVWSMIIPIAVYALLGERRQSAMDHMRQWMLANLTRVNMVILGLFGIFLLLKGLYDLT